MPDYLLIFPLKPGDEVNLDCWARDPDISKWMVENKYKSGFMEDREGYIDLWNTFQTKAYSKLEEAYQDKKINLEGAILWSSELTKPNHLHKYDSILAAKFDNYMKIIFLSFQLADMSINRNMSYKSGQTAKTS